MNKGRTYKLSVTVKPVERGKLIALSASMKESGEIIHLQLNSSFNALEPKEGNTPKGRR